MYNLPVPGTQPITAFLVAVVLFALGRLIIRHVVEAEGGDPWLAKALTVCLIVHLISAPGQLWVVDHLYGGVADFVKYSREGAALATGFRHLDFSLAPGQLGGIVGDGSVSIVTGVVMAVVGANQVGAFLVFSWLAFIGIMFFYRAFTATFSREGSRRYGYLVFFLPTLIFWTSDISKEATMTFLLGVTAFACARILARRGGANWPLIIACSAGGAFIRPHETLLALGGFTIAMIFRPVGSSTKFEGGRRTVSLILLGVMVFVALFVTVHFLPGQHGSISLNQINQNNQGSGAGFGSSGVAYSSSPLYFPRDVFTVLFDPLPFNAHSNGQYIYAFENTVLLVVVLMSLRQLLLVPRAAIARPYVIMCIAFTAAFCYAFASLGNLGLITREATVTLPFFLVPLCIPRGPRHGPPRYVWELPRRQRIARRRALTDRASAGVGGRAIST
jgi:hypothetical protein